MKVFLIGGTGFLGSAVAEELAKQGHEVSAIAKPELKEEQYPPEMKLEYKDYLTLSDDEIRELFAGCKGFIFAAGADERKSGSAPVYEYYKENNITPLERILRIAKECAVKHAVICGSYLSYFDKKWPELELSNWHPYIRSLRDQEEMALSFADENFSVAVLQLPFVFGAQKGNEPVWTLLIKVLRSMKFVTPFSKGGTTMITKKQAGTAIAGALEKTTGGKRWPIGCYNIPWREFLPIVQANMGLSGRKVITVPDRFLNMGIKSLEKTLGSPKAGNESGIFIPKIADLLSAETYIDRTLGCIPLGVIDDDIEKAIGESIRFAVDILDGNEKKTLTA